MKVIDLLNKIANGEEVPKKIRILSNNEIFNYEKEYDDYIGENDDGLFNECIINTISLTIFLNDEVEIIEPQEHKIPEKLVKNHYLNNETFEQVDADLDFIIDKINEIIDYLGDKE